MIYAEEKAMLGKEFQVVEEWKIGNAKMKVGDRLTVMDYGSDGLSNYVVFENNRLPQCRFMTGTWRFKRNTKPG